MSFIFGASLTTAMGVSMLRRSCPKTCAKRAAHAFSGGIFVTDSFDSGNISVIDTSDPLNIQLAMKLETFTEYDQRQHSQWFHFQVSNAQGQAIKLRIMNAGNASYAGAYEGYWAFVSYDRKNWERVPSSYDGEVLEIAITPEKNIMWVAYYPPFSYEQHMELIGECAMSPHCDYEAIGRTVQGRSIDMLKVGTGDAICWIHARTHPGETQAEWWMKGFLATLLGDSKAAEELRKSATLYIIPSMNPDGAVMGHLRTNAQGANLNREWTDCAPKNYLAPDLDRSPEVFYVRQKMAETGVDFFLDVHGDEKLPANFLSGGQGCSNYGGKLAQLFQLFSNEIVKSCGDFFQQEVGYGNGQIGKANMAVSSNYIHVEHDCLSATLEMPYKPLASPVNIPFDHLCCEKFGCQFVEAIARTVPHLKKDLGDAEVADWAQSGFQCGPWKQPSYKYD